MGTRPNTKISGTGSLAKVSVVVPVTEVPSPLDELYSEYAAPLKAAGIDHEFVFLFGGGVDGRAAGLRALQRDGEPIRILSSVQANAEAALSQAVLSETSSEIILTLPSYSRIDPAALPDVLKPIEEGFDMVSAARSTTSIPWINRLQRRSFHALLRMMTGGNFTDVACGVRAVRRHVLAEVDLYGDSFRFVPLFAWRDGFRVTEVPVEPHREDARTRLLSPGVYLRRLVDLVGLMFLIRFTYKPLRFFGLLGAGLFGFGFAVLTVLVVQRFGGRGMADRPLLLLGVLLLVVGLQSISLGLIGEIIVHQNVTKRPLYRLIESSRAD